MWLPGDVVARLSYESHCVAFYLVGLPVECLHRICAFCTPPLNGDPGFFVYAADVGINVFCRCFGMRLLVCERERKLRKRVQEWKYSSTICASDGVQKGKRRSVATIPMKT